MDIERKAYTFKATLQDNVIKGGPAVIGNMDAGCDVIFPGAFDGVLGDFLKNGFIAYGHEWDDLPIAMPTVAKEQGNILYSEAIFHSTQAAQDARTVAKERLDNNLTVGLSIGFCTAPDGTHVFESGQDMLDWARGAGMNMAVLDQKGIAACDMWCRAITKFDQLFEWSIVPVPMNRAAGAMSVKSWAPNEDEEFKTASGNPRLPIAARDRAWDGPAAEKSVREWAGAADGPNAKYRQGFFWYDSANADQWGSYHLGFADVVDGRLTAIPRGIFACAGAIQGARGADGEKYADAKPKIAAYYKRMAAMMNDDTMKPPWEAGKSLEVEKFETLAEIEDCLREAGGFSKSAATRIVSAVKSLLREAEGETEEKATEETASEKPVVAPPPKVEIVPVALTPLEEEILKKKRAVARQLHQRFLELDARIAKSVSQIAGAH